MKQRPDKAGQPQKHIKPGSKSSGQKPGSGNSRPAPTQQSPLVVVGIGTSANGAKACRELLSAINDAAQLALVLVQNGDPAEKPLLAELIETSPQLAVVEIQGRKKLKPNTVYICPLHKSLQVQNGFVRLSKPENSKSSGPIDHFLYSLAGEKGLHGVGVILSGAGADGTLGLKAISDHGGLSLAQSTDSAQNETMPYSAATAGIADFVLSPQGIAQEIQNYVRYLREVNESGAAEQRVASIEAAIPEIAERLMKVTNHNFLHYKTSTLVRRIQRRMQVLKCLYIEEYVDFLQHHRDEVTALFRELLIGITHFFRDPDAFQALKLQVLPKIFGQRQTDDCVRIWLAGCANGAEAYTIAILCREIMDDIDDPCTVQIFATDIDERALQTARKGSYPSAIAETISAHRLRKYFTKRGKEYVVNQQIRNLVMFSSHNLISDPPFSSQDLIVCRNLLIYLGPHLQHKLTPLFHYALRPGGYLFLGPSEGGSANGELFRPVGTNHSIFQRKGTAVKKPPSISFRQNQLSSAGRTEKQPEQQPDLTAIAQRIVLDEFAPKYAVVDDAGRIINTSADIDKYLRISGGDYENNIVRLAAGGLRIGLRAALSEARKSRRRVDHDQVSIRVGDKTQQVMLTVQPMPRLGEDEALHMVVFQEMGLPFERSQPDQQLAPDKPDAETIIAQMENELEATRYDLDKSLQDLEAANEELQSSNEELLSMNEELQSANEELETSKEQIRSSSEAVSQAKTDLENLLRSSRIATVFLDETFCIRSFTPAFTEIYNLISADIGRPLSQFVPNVADMPPLPDPESVAENGVVEHTVSTKSGRAYIRRVLPYCLVSGETKGIVVTFSDVTELRESEELLKRSLTAAQQNAFHADLVTMELRQRGPLKEVLGLTGHSSLREFFDLIHPEDFPAYQQLLQSRTPEAALYSNTHRVKTGKGDYIWLKEMGEVAFDNDNSAARISGTYQDVTSQQNYRLNLEAREKELRDTLDRLDISLSASGAAAWSWDVDNDRPIVSDAMKQVFGFDAAAAPDFDDFVSRIHHEDRQRVGKANFDVMHKGGLYEEEYRVLLPSGDVRWLRATGRVVLNSQSKLENFFGVAFDITDQKNREMEVVSREAHLRRVIDNTLTFIGVLDYQGTLKEVNKTALEAAGITRRDVIGKSFWECFWWSYSKSVAGRLRTALNKAKQGEMVRYDEIVRMADGSRMTIDFMLVPVKDEAGNITHIIPSGTDISERKQQEKQLAETLKKLDLAIAVNDAAVWNWDAKLNQPVKNESLNQLFGFAVADNPQLEDFMARIHKDDRARVQAAIDQSVEAGGKYEEDYRINLPTGETRWLRAVGRGDFTSDGKFIDFFGLIFDATDRKKRELALQASESRLRRVIDSQLGLIALLDANGRVTEINGGFVNINKLRREQVLGQYFVECPFFSCDAKTSEIIATAMQQAAAGNITRFDIQFCASLTDQASRRPWFDFMIAPVTNAEHQIEYFVASGIDISHRKQFEEDIRLSEERIYLAAKIAGFATFSVDLEQPSVIWSDEFLELVGLTESARQGKQIGGVPDFVHPCDRDKVEKHISHVLNSDEATDHLLDHRIIRPDNTERFVRMQSRVIYQGDGADRRKKMIIGTLLDITHQRVYEQELEASKNAAEAANRSKSEFLANMSHEIRTPMSAIMGYADILSKSLADNDSLNCVAIIRNNGQYLLEIINDILDLSKIEAGKLEVAKSIVSIAGLLAGVQSLMQVRATEKALQFSVEIAQGIPATIETDPTRLRQVLINLIGNAIKFTEKGSVKLLVSYQADHGPANLRFDVIDTGIGISAEKQKLIFEPFMQSDTGASRNFSGSGLGLTISRRLTEMLGGQITLNSVVGQGTIFTLKIGVGVLSEVPLIRQDSLNNTDNNVSAELTENPRLVGSILVVDDQQEIRFLAQHAIASAGGQVAIADNGQQALNAVRIAEEQGRPFDVLVMDMQMPVLDGYEATRRLRAAGFDKPVIALTANAMDGDREKSLQAGCTEHLIKPFDTNEFIRLLHQYLADSSQVKESAETRILLVDDSKDMTKALATLLELKGYQAETANDGASALILAQSFRPQVVLLDLGLPDACGFDVLRKMKSIKGLSHTKFIALTGKDNKEECLKAGFDHHILKPVDTEALSKWINETGQ